MREIVLDTETTGLEADCKVIEIACVELFHRVPTGNTYCQLINPKKPIEQGNPHGIALEDLLDKPIFSEIVNEFLDFIGDSPIVAHNAEFDFNVLNRELESIGRQKLKNKKICTLEIARKINSVTSNSLDALKKRYKVYAPLSHRALADAEALGKIYYFLCIKEEELCVVVEKEEVQLDFPIRPEVEIEEKELVDHEKLIEKIKGTLF